MGNDRARFIDVDATIFHPGTNDYLSPETLEQLKAWSDAGDRLYMWTLRPFGAAQVWLNKLIADGVKIAGYFQKPMAEEYYVYDDKLVEGHQSIACPHRNLRPLSKCQDPPYGAIDYCNQCNIYLYFDEWHRAAYERR